MTFNINCALEGKFNIKFLFNNNRFISETTEIIRCYIQAIIKNKIT